MRKSNSEAQSGISILDRLNEYKAHFQMRRKARGDASGVAKTMDASLTQYREVYSQVTGSDLSKAVVFEMGYGARPLRMFWMHSHDIDAWGVDLDRPIITGSPLELLAVARTNGANRLFKSIVRHFLFDVTEWRGLDRELKTRGQSGLKIHRERLLVGDIANFALPDQLKDGVDFIYSNDVIEHIPRENLDLGLARMAKLLKATGCIILQPHLFTSFGGGHLPEWYAGAIRDRSESDECRSEPWEHLRKKRFKANTYLNELRLNDYRELISRYFTIVEERRPGGEIGRPFLTAEVRSELSEYSEEELLADKLIFICKSKGQ